MEDLLPWFALKSVPGIGNLLFKRLMDRFSAPERVFEASTEEMLHVEGMSARLADAVHRHRIPDRVKKDLDGSLQRGYRIVTQAAGDFPPLLREIPDPPPFLYVHGRLTDDIRNIAVVGSRNATRYGITTANRLGADLALRGITVVSGMALGIDSAAHEGALAAGGRTVAVLGSGLGKIYPAQNRNLFHRIAQSGAVVSEFPLMADPDGHNFPVRNRIISGMSLGTVVVEATRRSGSLITAGLAAEQNREVFAVPGSIHSFKSTGTHTLIKQGAKLAEHAGDIIEELSHMIGTENRSETVSARSPDEPEPPLLSPGERLVFEALSPYTVHIDHLVRELNMQPGKLSGILLQLELRGLVRQSPGKMFSKEKSDK